jgi:DNA/RNA-binding domain of Phe-tRNA-synthetase-like protein
MLYMKPTLALEVEQGVVKKFPEVAVGGFLVGGLKALNACPADLMQRARAGLIDLGLCVQNLSDEPRVAAWRDAFRRMGLKPSAYKSSPEQLARRLLKGDVISTPLPVVDTYCAISAGHLAAMGGYDLARLPVPKVVVRFAEPASDRFVPLSGRAEDMPLSPDVVVYACGAEVICYGFNYRDSRKTCLGRETDFAAFFSEGVAAAHVDPVSRALAELRRLLSDAGASVGPVRFASKESPGAVLSLEG